MDTLSRNGLWILGTTAGTESLLVPPQGAASSLCALKEKFGAQEQPGDFRSETWAQNHPGGSSGTAAFVKRREALEQPQGSSDQSIFPQESPNGLGWKGF